MMTDLLLNIGQTFLDWDTQLSLAINGLHATYWDNFMMMFSGRFIWVPLYVAMFIVIVRHLPWRVSLACLVAIVCLITINDQLTASVIRGAIGRMRPSNLSNPIAPMVHIVNGYRSGSYGFPSAHAANCCGAAFFACWLFRRRLLSATFLVWAFLTCYSRVYLGVHYVGDILAGALLAFITSTAIYYLFKLLLPSYVAAAQPHEGATKMYAPSIVFAAEVVLMLILSFWVNLSF